MTERMQAAISLELRTLGLCHALAHADQCASNISAVIRALPLPESDLPADVIALVIAAREALESDELSDSAALDKAVEAFASRVCYDDDGGTLPEAHADTCTCRAPIEQPDTGVTQADREAAAEFAFSRDNFKPDPEMRLRWHELGEALPLVQAFARHRVSAIDAALRAKGGAA